MNPLVYLGALNKWNPGDKRENALGCGMGLPSGPRGDWYWSGETSPWIIGQRMLVDWTKWDLLLSLGWPHIAVNNMFPDTCSCPLPYVPLHEQRVTFAQDAV